MIVGGSEEIRLDEPARELYVADNYLGGRVMVFDLDTFAFKRGWGAYGHKLVGNHHRSGRSRLYVPSGPMPKEFRGHLTLNFSNDGLVYAADRNANRIHVTDKQGKFIGRNSSSPTPPGQAVPLAAWPSRVTGSSSSCTSPISPTTPSGSSTAPTARLVGRLGSMGDQGGQFYGLHMIAVDSRGNIYTGEVQNGERVQRFVPVN